MLTALLGFLIATAIAITGVGAGSITAPALILWLGVSPATAVGTALTFGAIVKFPAALAYLRKHQIHWPSVLATLAGGLPGVILGSTLLGSLDRQSLEGLVLIGVGGVVVVSAGYSLFRAIWQLRSKAPPSQPKEFRLRRLAFLCLPIGLEVGFSSAGAGALGTLAIMHATPLAPAAVVGTDIVFGLGLSTVGSGLHLALGSFDSELVLHLVAGGLLGSVFGANLATYLPAKTMRMILLAWLTYIGLTLAYKGLEKMHTHAEEASASTGSAVGVLTNPSAP